MKTPLLYGTLIAIVGALLNFGLYFAGFHDTPEKMKIGGWVALAVGLPAVIVLIALSMRERRAEFPVDREWGYGSALGTGVMTGLWSVLIGAVLTYIYFGLVNTQFGEVVYQAQVQALEAKGAPAAQIEGLANMKKFMTSPILMTVGQTIQGFIGAVVLSLIIAIFFRKRSAPLMDANATVPPAL